MKFFQKPKGDRCLERKEKEIKTKRKRDAFVEISGHGGLKKNEGKSVTWLSTHGTEITWFDDSFEGLKRYWKPGDEATPNEIIRYTREIRK